MESKTRKHTQSKFNRTSSFMVIATLMIVLPGCDRGHFSNAKGKASNLTCEAGAGIVKGEMDAGVNVKLTVKNVGEAGFITIKPELSTSEGEWSRSQDIKFNAGESQSLTYFFEEPTINARNIQCRVKVIPNAP